MFVQSARFVEEHRRGGNQRLSIYGQERVEETVKLCKMNLAVHGLEGQVSQSAEPLPHVSRRRGVLRTRRVGWKPHRSSRGYSAISASPDPELRRPLHRSCRCWRDLQHSSGGPNEASQFASDRGQHLVWPDPTAQMPIARMQPQLGMPGQVHDGFGHIRLPLFECASHTWGMPRMVSGLAEHVPQQPVARLGDWSTMLLAASRRLRGNHAGAGHELRCRSEAAQYRTCRCCIISTGPASTYVALRGMSFVRPRRATYVEAGPSMLTRRCVWPKIPR